MMNALVKSLLVILLGILLTPACSRAQYLGSVSPVTVQQTLAPPGTACNGGAQLYPVQNLGQGNHFASVYSTTATSIDLQIFGIDSTGNLHLISEHIKIAGLSRAIAAGSGYYPKVVVRVSCLPAGAGAGTYSLDYSGGSSVAPINSGDFLTGQVEKNILHAVDGAVPHSDVLTPPPFANSLGKIFFQYQNNSITGSTLAISCVDNNVYTYKTFTFALQPVASVQMFTVPSMPCARINLAYTFGAGGPGNIQELTYLFLPPSSNGSPPTGDTLSSAINDFPIMAEKGARWSVLHTPAVDLKATASKALGAVGVRHVADCVSYSLGAIAAPTATVLTLNLRDGATGAGTIIWSKTLAVPATTGVHADGNLCGLNLIGTATTAMTLEFAAGLTAEYQSVSLTGYDVQ